jgi:beta-lactamase class A
VQQLLSAAGAQGGVTLTELGGRNPQSWSLNGDEQFTAASTYKLPLLMEEAQNVTAGRWHGTDSLCYQDNDWEDGYYTDYQDGLCMSRSQLESRVGLNSDNTAAHILVRYAGGTAALNKYAQAHGAKQSAFYDPNTTTTGDLARLWVDEAAGHAGGRTAQQYLYPVLTRTSYEDGIPAGVPAGTTVVHKIGILDTVVNDAALVPRGPHGGYVLTICTQGLGGDTGWKLIADISRAVWQFEASR